MDDALTYQLFSEGNTIGVFQFESPGMQKNLKALKPTVFGDLIAMNALYRPGPMQYVPSFINRKHGKEAIEYDFPIMEQRLKETYGVTVYQEQVMLLSRDLAGFTRGQSDELRKAMGKKIQTKMDSLKVKFMDGATKNGFGPQEKLEKIWNDWSEFAKYAFNKSHATCYSWVAYQTAYLKAHYPAEFFAANLTCQVNNLTEVANLVEDANRMNIQILGPDINESDVFFTVNKKGQIRFGLSALKGSGISAAENIVNERNKNGNYESVFDFLKRVNLRICNKKTMDALVSSGAFDCFSDIHRAQYFQETAKGQTIIELLLQWGVKIQNEQAQAQISLFDVNPDAAAEISPEIPNTAEWSFVEQLKNEKEICGFYISGHPLDQYKLAIRCFTNTHLGELNDENNFPKLSGKLLQFVGIVTSHQKMTDKNGREYGRIKFEDQNNEFSWMLFRESYSKFKHLFDIGSQLFIKATVKVSSYMDADKNPVVRYNLEPSNMFVLEDIYEKMCNEVFLYLNINDIDVSLAQELERGFHHCKGKYPLFIKIISNDEKTNVDFGNFTIKVNPEKILKELKLQVWHEWELR
jgi:DNA polymerase-3 subunit alpha